MTPLFFVGAALGNVLARALGLPLAIGAGVGLAAVFAAAAKTPLSLSVMAVELLGRGLVPARGDRLRAVLLDDRSARHLLRAARTVTLLVVRLAVRSPPRHPRPWQAGSNGQPSAEGA